MKQTVNEQWPEMELLVDGLSHASTGKGRCFGVSGPVGVGKSYLLRNLEKTARSLGFNVLKGTCEPGTGPRGAFSALLMYSPRLAQAQEHPLFLLELLEEVSGVGPILLTIEDVHLADSPVISVIILMARSIANRPVMIVFTYNSEKVDTACGDAHPLVDGLRILTREGAYEEIKLKAMGRPSLLSSVEEEIMGKLDPSLADLIWERSEGNPMVAMEAVRLLIQSRLVNKVGGVWRPVGSLAIDLPDNYKAMIEGRLQMLPSEDLDLLTIAAVAGRSFNPWVIARIQNRRPLEVLEQLDRLAHDHHLVEEDSERYRFVSGSVRSVLLDNLSEERSIELHVRIAKVLEASTSDYSFNELSEHYYQAGLRERCVCFSLLAAERCICENMWEEALKELEKVLEASADGSHTEERRYAEARKAEVKSLMRL